MSAKEFKRGFKFFGYGYVSVGRTPGIIKLIFAKLYSE